MANAILMKVYHRGHAFQVPFDEELVRLEEAETRMSREYNKWNQKIRDYECPIILDRHNKQRDAPDSMYDAMRKAGKKYGELTKQIEARKRELFRGV